MLGSRALSVKRVSVACASMFLILGVAFSSNMNFISNASAFSSREAFVSALSVSGSLVDRLYSFWGYLRHFKGYVIRCWYRWRYCAPPISSLRNNSKSLHLSGRILLESSFAGK